MCIWFQCFVAVVKGDNACIGYLGIFRVLGALYLVDTLGNPRYILSKDMRFPYITNYAISKFYAPLKREFEILKQFKALYSVDQPPKSS